jgi:hypothetical protein
LILNRWRLGLMLPLRSMRSDGAGALAAGVAPEDVRAALLPALEL